MVKLNEGQRELLRQAVQFKPNPYLEYFAYIAAAVMLVITAVLVSGESFDRAAGNLKDAALWFALFVGLARYIRFQQDAFTVIKSLHEMLKSEREEGRKG